MASMQKFTAQAVFNQVRHNERLCENPSNQDIDHTRMEENYILSPDREISSYDYYKQRKSELYCYNRDDVKVMAGWIVTMPQDLPLEQEEIFFQATYDFLAERYHEENVITAAVHKDESGQPHLHFYFIPVVEDIKHGGEKICANDLLNRQELRNFHPDLQRYLYEHDIDARVMSGTTAAQGGNMTVAELKRERELSHEHEYERLVF